MLTRRRFVTSLGTTTLVPAFTSLAQRQPEAPAHNSVRSRVDLNGAWERHSHGKLVEVIQVPSSLRPSGFYHLRRTFLLPKASTHTRFYLHFEAITYHGRAFINDQELGTMAPYVPYDFDITAHVREGNNLVDVAIADFCPDPEGRGQDEIALGLNPGWEGYGGIIRDVYVESRTSAFIDNVRLAYELQSGYARASCGLKLFLSSDLSGPATADIVVKRGNSEIAHSQRTLQVAKGNSETDLSFEVNAPALWSPETPNLYEVTARLRTEAGEDTFHFRTGFREILARGTTFELNGKPLVLNGICRHDMWQDQGFTLSRAQMEADMKAIKALGCNFVRLVHYPHHRYIVDLADELGLLVTDEPGYWQVNFKTIPRSMIDLGLAIMERAIRRDWNSPSVFAWFLGNESRLTVEYLREGKALCRRLDPIARLVSFASDTRKEEAKPIFEESGMDFFDQHPYTYDVEEFSRQAEFFGTGKPLIFSEWGGKAIGQSEFIMQATVDKMLDMVESKRLAGHMFWSWQDLPEFSRIDGEMRDGILESGVVTENRTPRQSVYMELARLFQGWKHETPPVSAQPTFLPLRRSPSLAKSRFQTLNLQAQVDSAAGMQSWASLERILAKSWDESPETWYSRGHWKRTGGKFRLWQDSPIQISGIPFTCAAVEGFVRPLVVTPDTPRLTLPVEQKGVRLHVLGHVTVPGGFPPTGHPGETVATYSLLYEGNRKPVEMPLRNGIEVARANTVYVCTRIDAVATAAQPAIHFVKDWAREQYQVLLYSVAIEPRSLKSLTVQLMPGQAPLLLFAITVEQA